LPPALAAGKGINLELALAKRLFWLKPVAAYSFYPPAKAGGNSISFKIKIGKYCNF